MIKKASFLLFILWSLTNYSQKSDKSPYSFFGIGDTPAQSTISSLGMGGLSLGLQSTYELNFSDPSSLSDLKLTSFDIGGQGKFLTIDDGTEKQSSNNSTLSYLALGFPIIKDMGFMLGLQPNSNVGYYLTNKTMNTDDNITEISIYEGNGSTNRLFLGLGYRIFKGLSLGVESEFLFGTINNEIVNNKAGIALQNHYTKSSKIRGNAFKLSASYKDTLTDKILFKVENSIGLSNHLKSSNDEYLYSFYYNSKGSEIPQDTLISNNETNTKIKRPLSFHLGIGVGEPNKWFAGIEYNNQDNWSYPSGLLSISKVKYSKKTRLSLGGYFTPKINSISSYWNRVTYRAGLKYEKPGLSIRDPKKTNDYTTLKDFGISFGLGLPIGNQMSKLNLGVEVDKRGTTEHQLIQENYVNLRVGLNIAEKWFNKRKID